MIAMILMNADFLSQIDRLDLLFKFRIPVYVPGEVVFEATSRRAFEVGGIQNANEIAIEEFIRQAEQDGKLRIVKTLICEAAEQKRAENPAYRSKGDGQVAANSLFLNRERFGIHGPVILLYGNAKSSAPYPT